MTPSTDAAALESLETLVQTAAALLEQLQDVLDEIRNTPETVSTATTSSTSSAPLDALSLARDSTTLIKAHATKISLLIINKPFTPSAISSVVRELVAGPIPGLAASVQACDSYGFTLSFRRELAWRCRYVFSELADLLRKIPSNGKSLTKEDEGFGASGKGSIASTAVLLAVCDKVTSLACGGVSGFFVGKMKGWKDILNDIMEEMKEWGDEEPEDEEDDDDNHGNNHVNGLTDQVGSSHMSTQNILDDLMNSHRCIPLSDPDGIRPRLDSSLRRLRLVILLYQAIIRHRMMKLPPLPNRDAGGKVPRRLDELASLLQKLPDSFGDLACAFYELRPGEIDHVMDQCFLDAFAVSELLGESWDGSRDDFTEWTERFQREIRKA